MFSAQCYNARDILCSELYSKPNTILIGMFSPQHYKARHVLLCTVIYNVRDVHCKDLQS